MMRKEEKTAIIEQYATHPGDTGSPEVQIAVLTSRINELTEHLLVHSKTKLKLTSKPAQNML